MAMRWYMLPLWMVAAVGLSCGSDNPPQATREVDSQALAQRPSPAGDDASHAVAPANRSRVVPNIPEGARWTIRCAHYTGPTHQGDGKMMKDYLLRNTNLKDWYLVQSENGTSLYYGYYREIDERTDKVEGGRAQNDRRVIANLIDPRNGDHLFQSVLLMPLEEADPVAPAQWDLRNADGYWSLQIAAMRDDPKRKEKAVEIVKALRAEGREAYYYHGPTISSVCVGCFPREAASKPGFTDQGVSVKDPNEEVMVVPGSVSLPGDEFVTPDGRRIKAFQAKLEIHDARLMKLMEEFPTCAVNGVDGKQVMIRGKVVDAYNRSVLVVIPHEQRAQTVQTVESRVRQPDLSNPLQPEPQRPVLNLNAKPTQPQGGKLRSLDQ